MGLLFELIADKALEQPDAYYDECHVCHRTDIALYPYQGKCRFENGETDDDIYVACRDCILTENLSHSCDFEYIRTIEHYIVRSGLPVEEQELQKKVLIEKYQRTPAVPVFMQYEDRPLCCNDITEFTGHPADQEELYTMTANARYWEKEVKGIKEQYDFRKQGNPESFRDVASFKCRHCDQQYITFQFT